MGVSKIVVRPKSSILIGFSIIFTIHFGVPLFLETPIPKHYIRIGRYIEVVDKQAIFFGTKKQFVSVSRII